MTLAANIQVYQTGVYAVTRLPAGSIVNGRPQVPAPIDLVPSGISGNEITATAHELATGAGPMWLTAATTQPGGVDPTYGYFAIVDSANTLRLAMTVADAMAGNPVTITSSGAGALSLSSTFQLPASVRPLKANQLQDMPEGQRIDDVAVVYSLGALLGRTDDNVPDTIVIDGATYRVWKSRYSVLNGYYKSYVEKVTLL